MIGIHIKHGPGALWALSQLISSTYTLLSQLMSVIVGGSLLKYGCHIPVLQSCRSTGFWWVSAPVIHFSCWFKTSCSLGSNWLLIWGNCKYLQTLRPSRSGVDILVLKISTIYFRCTEQGCPVLSKYGVSTEQGCPNFLLYFLRVYQHLVQVGYHTNSQPISHGLFHDLQTGEVLLAVVRTWFSCIPFFNM